MDTVNVQLFGMDPKIQKSIAIAQNVSVTKTPVLIIGEIGVGKKTLAQFIHQQSNRIEKPFAIVDCSLDAQSVENMILGHRVEETGRFNKGILESSNGGTVVLANVDGMEDEFQRRLHKILTELDDYDIDIRLIATTTKNLSKLVGSGRFYRGLYTLISTNSIPFTPLRERVNDLEMIVRYFLKEFAEDGREIILDNTAHDKILSYYWTHNIDELKAVIGASVEQLEGNILSEENIIVGEKKSSNMIIDDESEGIRLMSLKEAEKLLIKKALIHTSENRTQAAKILGVSIRTLRNKINEYRNIGSAYFVNLR